MNASKHKTKQLITLAAAIAGLVGSSTGWAVLPPNATLTFDDNNKTDGNNFFVMEVSPGFYLPTQIDGFQGLRIFIAQAASGSHFGAPNGSESPGIDDPWSFFGNTGMHFTATPPTILSAAGNTATLDFSGWRVTWNGIESINMGTGAWNNPGQGWTGNVNGVAQVTCAVDCTDGDTFTLQYTARVPLGDPSNFSGVAYGIKLSGVISVVSALGVLESDGAPVLGDGAEGGTATNDYQISAASLPADPDGYAAVGSAFDFSVSGLGAGGNAVVTLNIGQAIPAGAVYRKYSAGTGWYTFDTGSGDTIESGAPVGGSCLAADGVVYAPGLTAGDSCVRLTIQDNGVNDADGLLDGTVVDPGVVAAIPAAAGGDTRTSGSSGCAIATTPASIAKGGDWLLIGLALAGLAWLRRRAV